MNFASVVMQATPPKSKAIAKARVGQEIEPAARTELNNGDDIRKGRNQRNLKAPICPFVFSLPPKRNTQAQGKV